MCARAQGVGLCVACVLQHAQPPSLPPPLPILWSMFTTDPAPGRLIAFLGAAGGRVKRVGGRSSGPYAPCLLKVMCKNIVSPCRVALSAADTWVRAPRHRHMLMNFIPFNYAWHRVSLREFAGIMGNVALHYGRRANEERPRGR